MHVHNYEVSMGRFDEFVNFLFRTLKGRLALIGCTVFIACMCSGCYLCTCPAAMCENAGCEICADCFYTCDGSCGKSCDETCGCGDSGETTYGGGCCGAFGCGTCSTCGGCTCDTCGGCSSCGTCSGCSSCDEKDDPQYSVEVHYIAVDSEGNYIETLENYYYSFRESKKDDYTSVPNWNYDIYPDYFVFDSAYDSYNRAENEFGELIANSDGAFIDKDKALSVVDIYIKLVEKASVGEDYTIYFDTSEFVDYRIDPINARVGDKIENFPTSKDLPAIEGGKVLIAWQTGDNIKVTFRNGETFHPYKFRAKDVDIRLYAVYGTKKYVVTTYVLDNKSEFATEYGVSLSQALNGYTAPGVDGKRFLGWAIGRSNYEGGIVDIKADEVSGFTVIDDLALYAVYGNVINIELHYCQGPNENKVSGRNLTVGESFILPIPESAQGPYAFAGWYTSSDFGASSRVPSNIIAVTDDMAKRYYAKWDLVTEQQITYFVRTSNSETYIEYRRDVYTYNSTATTPLLSLTTDYIPVGHSFEGWRRDSADGTGDVMTALPAGTYGDLQLYAIYKPRTYELRLYTTEDSNIPGSAVEAGGYYRQNIEYASKIKLPVPTREGYDFTGWNERSTGTRFTDETGMMLYSYERTSSMFLQAAWEKKSYRVTFMNGTEVIWSRMVEHGDRVPASPEAPYPDDGYQFSHWKDAAGNRYSENATVTGDVTYSAVFVTREYTITLKLSGSATFADGSTERTVYVHYLDDNVRLPTPADSADYIFEGWKIEGTADSAAITASDGMLGKYSYTYNIVLVAVLTV